MDGFKTILALFRLLLAQLTADIKLTPSGLISAVASCDWLAAHNEQTNAPSASVQSLYCLYFHDLEA